MQLKNNYENLFSYINYLMCKFNIQHSKEYIFHLLKYLHHMPYKLVFSNYQPKHLHHLLRYTDFFHDRIPLSSDQHLVQLYMLSILIMELRNQNNRDLYLMKQKIYLLPIKNYKFSILFYVLRKVGIYVKKKSTTNIPFIYIHCSCSIPRTRHRITSHSISSFCKLVIFVKIMSDIYIYAHAGSQI